MPLYEYQCKDCGRINEILVIRKMNEPACNVCGSKNMTKQMSARSSKSGVVQNDFSASNDTACCGSSPDKAEGCAGPGSCCGRPVQP